MKSRRKVFVLSLIILLLFAVGGGILCYHLFLKEQVLTFSATNVGQIAVYSTTTKSVKRNIPTSLQNEGLCTRYPTYGTKLANITDEEKDNILKEDSLLRVSDSTYTEIDADGNLLLSGEPTGKKLYKHTASVGMYYGDVSDTEMAVEQSITITPIEYRNYITGLYAPAGEVVKIEISEEDLSAIGGLVVSVGQTSIINKNNNIWKARDDFSRMPNLGNFFTITKQTSYVGNFLGGPIYLKPTKIGKEFTVKISGAVKYPYYIHGLTTKEEFEEMKTLSAPYFDLEIWDTGVRHSGPKSYANFDYDNLVKVGDLWEKISRTSRRVPITSNSSMGIGFLYDVFVAAGEACAFQGANWVNAPCYWFPGALDYQSMTSNGFWGQIHEFNHHFQNYGINPITEVSNNATSLLSYVLYTDISSKRSENDSSLTGWNRYTDATRGLRETLQNAGKTQTSLNIYADILHTFGVDVFIEATNLQKTRTYTADAWYEALSKATGYNFTYYFETLIGQSLSDDVKTLYNTSDRKIFVPAAMLYQTGRNYYIDGKEYFSDTVKPFRFVKGEELVLDFEKFTYLPSDFTWEIKSITNPQNGTLTKLSDKKYKYSNYTDGESGEFYVTISLTSDKMQADDITFAINLKQKDPNPTKTLYKYETRKYENVDDAVAANFEGYTQKITEYTTSTFMNHIANKQIGVVEGKIYIQNDGEYTICLRAGRGNHALYTSTDGENYTKDIAFSGDMGGFDLEEKHIKKYTLQKGQYLYYKQVTISNGHSDAFTELGITADETAPKTVPSNILYNINAEGFVPYTFQSEAKYPREYVSASSIQSSSPQQQRLVSVNFGNWSDNEKIENIFDGDPNTFYHSGQNVFVSDDNQFELVVDLGEEKYFNKITFVGRKTSQLNLPCTFKLYAGLDLDNLELIGDYKDLQISSRTTSANFDMQKIRFYKIVVSDTVSEGSGYRKYVCFAEIRFDCQINGKQINPSNLRYVAVGIKSFKKTNAPSTFGSIISGKGRIEYSFKGSIFGIVVRQNTNAKIKVVIDGEEFISEISKSNNKEFGFLSKTLQSKHHSVKIYVLSGELCVDSVIIR